MNDGNKCIGGKEWSEGKARYTFMYKLLIGYIDEKYSGQIARDFAVLDL